MKLITIICEALARGPVEKLLADSGAHGHTVFTVEGTGSHGRRGADIQEFANIQFEVIVPPEVGELLLERLAIGFFDKFAMVAYETEIRVLRHDKF